MNCAQALAVAAAALVLAGDPWTSRLAQTRADLSARLARTEAVARRVMDGAAARIEGALDRRCERNASG